ncbi:MAG: hypothetical protein IJF62_03100 [Firmicutes bacterium]|nr:hypothetical protein [Bacillota bacterium]
MTSIFRKAFARFFIRLAVFLSVLGIYIVRRPFLDNFVNFHLFGPLTPMHLLWAILMGDMIYHLLPKSAIPLGGRKQRAVEYLEPIQPVDKLKLFEYTQKQNLAAWRIAIIWVLGNSVFAMLYSWDMIGEAELLLLSCFYFLSDFICQLFWCPFQTFMMKNRCCTNCRIYDWGHVMMYTPMMFIKSFFSWSLFFMALLNMLRWELNYAKHPERFYYGSNAALRCANCKDKMCHFKKPLPEGE